MKIGKRRNTLGTRKNPGLRKNMIKSSLRRFLFSDSDNPKSKIGTADEHLKSARFVMLVITFVICAAVAHAQQTGKIRRIGFLDNSSASGNAPLLETFRQEMRKLGWIEGKNFTFEYRYADGQFDRLPDLAADLVRLKVDLILVSGGQPALAAKNADTTIPLSWRTLEIPSPSVS